MKRFFQLSVAGLLLAGTASAQTPAQVPVEPAQPRATAPADAAVIPAYRAKHVIGTTVSIHGNVNIGTVDDIVFRDDGVIEYLIVENNGRLVTVPWEAAKFDFDKRTATVAISQEEFKVIPTYTVKQYPQFTPTYRTEIYKFYKVTPRTERRMERRDDRRP